MSSPLSYVPVLCLQALIFVGTFLFKMNSWFQIAARNGLHISEVPLRHFVVIFFKVFTLEEFKLPISFSTSALSMPEKGKVDVIVKVSHIFLRLGWYS